MASNRRYTIVLVFFFLSGLFFFSRRAIEPNISLYTDSLISSQTPLLLSPTSPESDSLVTPKSEDTKGLDAIPNNNIPTLIPQVEFEEVRVYVTPTMGGRETVSERSSAQEKTQLEAIPILSKSDNSSVDTKGLAETSPTLPKSDSLFHKVTPISRPISSKLDFKGQSCDLFKGSWVKDEENHPIYKPGSCPYVDEAFDCQSNGRRDSEYLKWRWKPHGCHLPRFSASDFLERLKGKRLMLVGDSMSRNQFESLLCLLREGLTNKSKMYEIHGYKITKGRGYYVFKFEDYNCTVEFVRSHFLVREGERINLQGSSNPTLSIDRINKTSNRWKGAEILIFNTGHWWTHGKTARGYGAAGASNLGIYPKFDVVEAYRRAWKTWAKWIDENMSREKLIIYCGYSSAHYRGGDWDSGGSCSKETEPVSTGAILGNYPLKMKIVGEVIKEMQRPVVLLNITQSTNFRKVGTHQFMGRLLLVVEGQSKIVAIGVYLESPMHGMS